MNGKDLKRSYRWLKNNLIPHKLLTSCSTYIQSAELTKFNNEWESKNDLSLYEKFDSIRNRILKDLRAEMEINGKEEEVFLGEKRSDKLNINNFFLKLISL